MISPFPWHGRPGLAGGIDKEGSRAAELLGLGFGSVEFGTVTARPIAVGNPGAAALAARLAALPPRRRAAVGVGLGLPPDMPPEDMEAEWAASLEAIRPWADYASFNLSAQASRRFLAHEHLARVGRVFRGLATRSDGLPLAVKLPLETGRAAALAAAEAGFPLLTLVLPEGEGRFYRLAALAAELAGGPALVAVGGIRNRDDVAAARAAGAAGVQVHRLFVEQGAACLAALL